MKTEHTNELSRSIVRGAALMIIVTGIVACGDSGSDASGGGEPVAEPVEGFIGTAPAAVGGIPTVVTLTPVAGAGSTESEVVGAGADDAGVIDQFGLTFSPPRLLVATGATMTFTNSESALTHNVHLRWIDGDSTVFNGDASTGEAIRVRLPMEGGYDVLCDMHPGMTAFVYATSAPYAVFAADDGAFHIASVPPGEYTVELWSADAGAQPAGAVTVGTGATEVRLPPAG
jgi:plastocyanin